MKQISLMTSSYDALWHSPKKYSCVHGITGRAPHLPEKMPGKSQEEGVWLRLGKSTIYQNNINWFGRMFLARGLSTSQGKSKPSAKEKVPTQWRRWWAYCRLAHSTPNFNWTTGIGEFTLRSPCRCSTLSGPDTLCPTPAPRALPLQSTRRWKTAAGRRWTNWTWRCCRWRRFGAHRSNDPEIKWPRGQQHQ